MCDERTGRQTIEGLKELLNFTEKSRFTVVNVEEVKVTKDNQEVIYI